MAMIMRMAMRMAAVRMATLRSTIRLMMHSRQEGKGTNMVMVATHRKHAKQIDS